VFGGDSTVGETPEERLQHAGVHNLKSGHAYQLVEIDSPAKEGTQPHLVLNNPWGERQPDPVPLSEVRRWFKAVDVVSVK
jgi:hypothetical protein